MKYPVFIVGSPRSGTSILATALQRAGYFGFNEGNFLTLIGTLDRIIDQHFKTFHNDNDKILIAHVDKQRLKQHLFEVICNAEQEINVTSPWMDKTGNPEMIQAIPALLAFWPDSHFIFAKRRAIENIVSRLRKFPNHTFEYHCLDWARNMQTWRRIRDTLPDLRALEVDQYEIGRAPDDTAGRIASFLGFDGERQEAMSQAFAKERPQQTAGGTAERILSLETAGWTPQQMDTFREVCSAEMLGYGYTMDARYWSHSITKTPADNTSSR